MNEWMRGIEWMNETQGVNEWESEWMRERVNDWERVWMNERDRVNGCERE